MTGETSKNGPKFDVAQLSKHVFSSILMANRAALTSLGLNSGKRASYKSDSETPVVPEKVTENWEVEKTVEEG
ncbi:MAG: hypothetical protein U5J64_05105 [Halobacteriales archaeon]|nr:hypothetical protein [Halobacteriales archaeon]